MKKLFTVLVVLLISVHAQYVYADETGKKNWDLGLGVTVGSIHFKNDLSRAPGFNETNFGLTAYFTDVGDVVPLADEFSVSYVPKNSYEDSSAYLLAHFNVLNVKHIDVALSAGVATGYTKRLRVAERLGVMPVAGIRITVAGHVEVGIFPFGILNWEKGVNTMTLSYRF